MRRDTFVSVGGGGSLRSRDDGESMNETAQGLFVALSFKNHVSS